MTVNEITHAVADFYKVPLNLIYSKRRDKKTAETRQTIMYLIRELIDTPYEAIGDVFRRDHATVIYAIEQVKARMANNGEYRSEVLRLLNNLGKFKISYFNNPSYSWIPQLEL